jgi:cbb3-type cytochrome oxidase maturation protein
MEIIYLLIPLSIILVAVIIGAFLWSVRSGQFDDLQGPAHRILMDDDGPAPDKDAHDQGNRGKDDPPAPGSP